MMQPRLCRWFLIAMPVLLALTCLCCAMPAMAQDEADAPPPEQADRVAPDDDMDPGAWQHEDEEDEESHFGSSETDAGQAAAGVAAASALAMGGVFMLWFGLYFGFMAFIMAFSMAAMVAMVLAIYDCARRDFPDPNTRALWCILIVMTRWIGALIYYILIYRNDDPPLAPAVAARPTTTTPSA